MCNVLQFIKQFFTICIVLHVVCYLLCMYIYMCCIGECGTRPEMSDRCKEWFLNKRISRSFEPCSSPSLSLPRPTLHTEMLLQNCSRTMQKRGAACNYKKGMQSPLQYSDSFKTAQGTVYKTSTSQ